MKLMAGNSNLPLAQAIADYCEIPLTKANVRRFADDEVFVEIHENVRGEDVFVVQSTSYPAKDNLMELLITLDALRRGSASAPRRRPTAMSSSSRCMPGGSWGCWRTWCPTSCPSTTITSRRCPTSSVESSVSPRGVSSTKWVGATPSAWLS